MNEALQLRPERANFDAQATMVAEQTVSQEGLVHNVDTAHQLAIKEDSRRDMAAHGFEFVTNSPEGGPSPVESLARKYSRENVAFGPAFKRDESGGESLPGHQAVYVRRNE